MAKTSARAAKSKPAAKATKAGAKGASKAKPAAKKGKGSVRLVKPTVQQDQLQPEPKAKALLKKLASEPTKERHDRNPQQPQTAKSLLKHLNKQNFEFHPAQASALFDSEAFDEFFMAEIEREVEREAHVVNDRFARWPCQCCDVVIPVPRRTEVFHGDYHLVHDDVMGLLVNGERWVPRAETPIQVVQPGRLRNPWTGKTLEGRDLGTTGVR